MNFVFHIPGFIVIIIAMTNRILFTIHSKHFNEMHKFIIINIVNAASICCSDDRIIIQTKQLYLIIKI